MWELPGGYVDPDENPAITAAREVEEETGWRPRTSEPLASLQPNVGVADNENLLFLSRGVDLNEAERVGCRCRLCVSGSRGAKSSVRPRWSVCSM
ncbi:NUDIX domain-containing protein [Amycolatopsis sp. NPDC004079]|uniref:NUDIX hydrolase n=1 Tax=Amycolatopsis sp. NPDC004079 TaxID=3154549 RepID=UPI0033A8F0C0